MFVNASLDDFNLQSSSPCIDAGDPLLPSDPDGTITDIGALYYPQASSPDLTVVLTPYNPPIQIPAGGGSFQWDLTIENIDIISGNFDAWIETVLPNGTVYGPIVLRQSLFLAAGGSLTRTDLTQTVPSNAPSGTYSYVAKAGNYPDNVVASDEFDFEKLVGFDSPNHNLGWSISGWDGETSYTSALPTEFAAISAYPNPFNPVTSLQLSLPESGNVSLVIYDTQGREVSKLLDGWYSSGVFEVTFNASHLSSGTYFAFLRASDTKQAVKLLLIR